MPIMARILLCIMATVVFTTTAVAATQVLTSEPPEGALKAGKKVLVDNGSCPKGRILEVTGGGDRNSGDGSRRIRRCIAREK